ncbi:MAG: restriction endonuclease subunit S [Psychroserpens sp.]|uniref:restriction endonuclease subunit S n=1 Tax=Psychroserpens sp. TaxID=2020870 RepID=UPI003002D01A
MNIDLGKAIDSKLDRTKWKKWKFSDLVDNIVEKVKPQESGLEHYIGLKHLDSGSLHVKRFGETESLIGDKLKIYKNDIIFAKRNAYLKRVSIAPFDAVVSAHSMVLRPKAENVLPEFLPFFLLSEQFWQRAIEISVGSLSPTINWKALAKQEFLLPPKDQQAKLAELLWAMDEVIEKGTQLLDNIVLNLIVNEKQIFASKTYCALKTAILNSLSGGTPNTKVQEFYSNGTIPWLTTKIIEDDYIEIGEKLITNDAVLNSAAKVLPKGNIIAGTRVGVGKFAINICDISFSQDVTGLIIDHSKVNIDFLVYQLNSAVFQSRLAPFLRGTTIKGILKDDLLNMKIYLPSMEKQLELKNLIKELKNSRDLTKFKISSSKALQKSLINQVF